MQLPHQRPQPQQLGSGGAWASWGHSPGEGCDSKHPTRRVLLLGAIPVPIPQPGDCDSGRGGHTVEGPRTWAPVPLFSPRTQPTLSEAETQRLIPRSWGQKAQGSGPQGGVG